jgi:hypothetical protein
MKLIELSRNKKTEHKPLLKNVSSLHLLIVFLLIVRGCFYFLKKTNIAKIK